MKVLLSKSKKGIYKCEVPSLKISKSGKDIAKIYEETISYANEIEKAGIKHDEKNDISELEKTTRPDSLLLYFVKSFYAKTLVIFIAIILTINFMINSLTSSLQFEIKTGKEFWEPLEEEFHNFANNIDENFEEEKRQKFLKSLIKIKKAYQPFFDELSK